MTPEDLVGRAEEIAARIAASAPLAVRSIKGLVTQGMDMTLPAGMELERSFWGLRRDTEDRIEGRRAFQEKRPPEYQGR